MDYWRVSSLITLAVTAILVGDRRRGTPDSAPYGRTAPAAELVKPMNPLRNVVADRPDDIEGLRVLAANDARLGNSAVARLIRALGVPGDRDPLTAIADEAKEVVAADATALRIPRSPCIGAGSRS